MAQNKSKPRSGTWHPQRDCQFHAYTKQFNRCHPAGPFTCTEVVCYENRPCLIEAIDQEEDRWQFPVHEFRFVPAVVQKAASGR